MCGICGIINFNSKPVDRVLLNKMNSLLIHRGPDGEGYYTSLNAGLAMRRLSIIDLETGSQPIYNEDKSLAVVFNGEIYNFQELRRELEIKHVFKTHSDTEVIVHLYEEYGAKCVERLRGMFAFAVWDERNKRLFIARDRMGKKPLYYTWIDGNFYFASEIKSFLAAPHFKKDINQRAIHYYLTYQYVPGPMTIWKNVFRLDPASFMIIDAKGGEKIEKYWEVDLTKKTELSYPDAREKLKSLLHESTKLRMISDVPLGAFLSGGHDSSIIVGIMSLLCPKVKTFSIGFDDKEFSELEYAKEVSEHFNTEHYELVVKPDYIDLLSKIAWHYDQPYADSSALPSYYVSRMTRRHVKVALNGDGGDENFAGYLRYKALKISQYVSPIYNIFPEKFSGCILKHLTHNETANANKSLRYLHRFVKPLSLAPELRNTVWHAYFTNELKQRVYSEEMNSMFAADNAYDYLVNKFKNAKASDLIDRSLYADLTAYLPENLLVKMDIASMANSLEARSPFLDHKLIEFTSSLPSQWKLKGLNTKHILKDAYKDFLPKRILKRGKQGFGIPLGKWFRAELKDYFTETVLSKKALDRGYFNPGALKEVFKEHVESRVDHGYALWALLMLEQWHRVFIDGDMTGVN